MEVGIVFIMMEFRFQKQDLLEFLYNLWVEL
nr:MAG TPA: hypothetical protein [Bacteriophage sp.]